MKRRLHTLSNVIALVFFMYLVTSILLATFWNVIVYMKQGWMPLFAAYFLTEGIAYALASYFLRGGEMTEKGIGKALKATRTAHITSSTGAKKTAVVQVEVGIEALKTASSVMGEEDAKQHEIEWTAEQIRLSKDMPIWKNPPKSFKEMTSFPHPIDAVDVRLKGAMMMVLISLNFLMDYLYNAPWIWIYISFSFVIRFCFASRLSPESLLVFFFRDFVKIKPHYEPGPAKRFAVFVGSCFCIAYLILRFAFQLKEAATWVGAVLLVFVSLETLFGYCTACTMFAAGMLMGLLPKSTCEQCKILFVAVDEWEGAHTTLQSDTISDTKPTSQNSDHSDASDEDHKKSTSDGDHKKSTSDEDKKSTSEGSN